MFMYKFGFNIFFLTFVTHAMSMVAVDGSHETLGSSPWYLHAIMPIRKLAEKWGFIFEMYDMRALHTFYSESPVYIPIVQAISDQHPDYLVYYTPWNEHTTYRPSQKETSIPTLHFQGRAASFKKGTVVFIEHSNCQFVSLHRTFFMPLHPRSLTARPWKMAAWKTTFPMGAR